MDAMQSHAKSSKYTKLEKKARAQDGPRWRHGLIISMHLLHPHGIVARNAMALVLQCASNESLTICKIKGSAKQTHNANAMHCCCKMRDDKGCTPSFAEHALINTKI